MSWRYSSYMRAEVIDSRLLYFDVEINVNMIFRHDNQQNFLFRFCRLSIAGWSCLCPTEYFRTVSSSLSPTLSWQGEDRSVLYSKSLT